MISRSPQADATLAGDRAAIYHRETRKALTLNPVGTLVWQALTTPQTRNDLLEMLQTRFPQVDQATLSADLEKFLAELRGHALIIES